MVNFALTFLLIREVTVIVAFPAFLPVTFPLDDTVATFLSLEEKAMFLLLIPLNDFTLIVVVFPTTMDAFFSFKVIFAFCFPLLTVRLNVPFTLES